MNLNSNIGDNTENDFNKNGFSGHAEHFLHFVWKKSTFFLASIASKFTILLLYKFMGCIGCNADRVDVNYKSHKTW